MTIRRTLYEVYKTSPRLISSIKRQNLTLNVAPVQCIELKLTKASPAPLQRPDILLSRRPAALTLFMVRYDFYSNWGARRSHLNMSGKNPLTATKWTIIKAHSAPSPPKSLMCRHRQPYIFT